MIDVSALEYSESADLMTAFSSLSGGAKDYSRLPMLVAILCRPKGEPYDEEAAIQRSETFESLTMDVVWSVFFSLSIPAIISRQFDQTYLLSRAGVTSDLS